MYPLVHCPLKGAEIPLEICLESAEAGLAKSDLSAVEKLLAEFSTVEADDETEESKRFSHFKAQDNPLLTDDIEDLRKWYMLK